MKKLTSILLCIFMAVTLLAGCAKNNTEDNAPANTNDADPAVTADANAGKSRGPIKIVRSKDARNLPANEMFWYKEYTKVSGIDVEWEEIPSESAREKVNLMLATQNLPDAFLGTLNVNMVMNNVDKGLFLPIEGYLDKMPNFSKVLAARPDYKKWITAPDGHIYGLPYIEEMFGLVGNHGILHIYKPWLDQLGLPIPKTVDEWRDDLKKFVETDMNKNGVKDEIGFALANKDAKSGIGEWGRNANDFGQFFGLWGQADRNDSLNLDKDGKVISTATTEAYKEGIQYFHQMFKDGLIDPEFTVTDGAKLQAKMRNPEVIVGSVITFSISDVVDAARAKDYVAVPYLQGPKGEYGTRENFAEMHNPVALVLTKDAKDPETILRWADGLYDPSWSVQTNWGPLGYQYKLNDQNVMVFDTLKDGLDTYSDMRTRNTIAGNSPVAVLKEYYDKVVEYPQDAQRLLNDMKAIGYVDKHLDDPFIPHIMFYEPKIAERMALLSPQVYGMIDTNRKKWISEGGIEKEWDSYLKEIDKAGWSEFIGYVQEAYTRVQNNK